MEIPKNLREVVQNVNPQAILLLDTNAILDSPKFPSDQFAVSGTFLSVIPDVVNSEIMALKLGDSDKKTVKKATSALETTWEVYMRGDPESGIKLQNGSWLMTIPSVRAPGSVVNDQARKQLGAVDAALLRLTGACTEDVPDIPAILITGDRELKQRAKDGGLRACSLSDLHKPEVLNALLVTDRPIQPLDLDTLLSPLSPDEAKPVKVALTLEELRSEGDYLIARGSGIITWHSEGYPFHWTFPYKNAEKVKNLEDWVPDDVMPLENLNFFGKDEQLPEPVRRRVCFRLEEQAVYGRLQSPSIRAWIMFGIYSDWLDVGIVELTERIDPRLLAEKSLEERKFIDKARQYAEHVRPLLDGTAKLSADSYAAAFESYKALVEQTGKEPVDEDPMSGLDFLFDCALDGWSVGSTIESETSSVEKAIKIIDEVLGKEGELNDREAVED